MRKNRKKLTNQEIERVFLRDETPSGVVAVYMYRRQERNIVNVMKRQEKRGGGGGGTGDSAAIDSEEEEVRDDMRQNIHDPKVDQKGSNGGDLFFEYLDRESLRKFAS